MHLLKHVRNLGRERSQDFCSLLVRHTRTNLLYGVLQLSNSRALAGNTLANLSLLLPSLSFLELILKLVEEFVLLVKLGLVDESEAIVTLWGMLGIQEVREHLLRNLLLSHPLSKLLHKLLRLGDIFCRLTLHKCQCTTEVLAVTKGDARSLLERLLHLHDGEVRIVQNLLHHVSCTLETVAVGWLVCGVDRSTLIASSLVLNNLFEGRQWLLLPIV